MKKIARFALLLIPILIWTALITLVIDTKEFNCRLYNYTVYQSDCNYQIPEPYKLGRVGNRYIIYYDDYGRWGLGSYTTAGLQFDYLDVHEPSTFADTCAAKGALESYMKHTTITIVEPIKK